MTAPEHDGRGVIEAVRFQQIADVFDAAADAARAERTAVLRRLCGDDAALRIEVESLLAASPDASLRIAGAIGHEAGLVAEEANPRRIDDRYVVLEQLGEGGIGVVYCARDRLTGQRVAIKRVHVTAPARVVARSSPMALVDASVSDAAAQTGAPDSASPLLFALAREFRTLASIRHPHIISVLDYGFGPTREPFFTMELLEDAKPLLIAGQGSGQVRARSAGGTGPLGVPAVCDHRAHRAPEGVPVARALGRAAWPNALCRVALSQGARGRREVPHAL